MRTSENPEATFLAIMTASATHEVRNVLAIIKESAGLIEDLMWSCRNKGVLDEEKVSRTVDRIDTQVKRGAELLTNLNRLSHTLDQDLATVDLNEEIHLLAFLCQRLARKNGCQISAEPGAQEVKATVHPLRLHMALFTAMECCLDRFPEGVSVTLRAVDHGGRPSVDVVGISSEPLHPPDIRLAEDWGNLSRLLDTLNAVAEPSAAGAGFRILFQPVG
ncbi:hypothetical protein ACFL3S_09970 [Gemmatimonadota bacterium]